MQLECFCRFSLSPRGDGNRRYSPQNYGVARFSLSPRGDGNPARDRVWQRDYDFLYPREGTETLPTGLISTHADGFSLSPRGDGNQSPLFLLPLFLDFLYPREGTETICLARFCSTVDDFLYPREGTETHTCASRPLARGDFLYPREGTETAYSLMVIIYPYRFSLSPRGDGNACLAVCSVPFDMIFFIPVRGRKQFTVRGTVPTTEGFSLSPRGDGNGV